MSKKLLSLLLALVLVFSLVACSTGGNETTAEETTAEETTAEETTAEGEETEAEEVSAEPLTGSITVQAEEGWQEYYQKAADKIMDANPDANIELIVSGAFDHVGIINETNVENEDVADVFAIAVDQFGQLARNDVFAAVNAPAMADKLGGFDNLDAGLAGNLKDGDEYLAFPFNIESLAVFVNTANAEAAGIDHTQPVEMNDVPTEATVLLPMFDAWYGVAPNLGAGIDLLAQDGDTFKSTYTGTYEELNETQKSVFDGLYAYWKRHNEAGTAMFDADAGWGYIDEEFTTGGNGVFRIGGPWDAATFQSQAGEGNIAVYPINHISVAGTPLKHWQGGWALAVNARVEGDAEKQALAEAMIMEIVNPENAIELYQATGKLLENVPAEVYSDSDLSDIDKATIAEVFESFAVSEPRPTFPEFGPVWDTWKNSVLSWNTVNPADPAAAYAEVNAAFTTMMQQLGQ